MYPDIGNAIKGLLIMALVMVPFALLGIWKLIEGVIWLFQHVSFT
jgi:hypothetical protein